MTTPIISSLQPFLQQVWEKSEFETATPVQELAIPKILTGDDLLIESPTGTGKTLAYLIPIIEKINKEKQHPQAIILAPSKELAMQILGELQKWTKGSDIVTTSIIGGVNIKRQLEKLKDRPQIIVGTPGRLIELVQMKKIKMHEVKTVVLDEGDQLLTSEHLPSIKNIVKATLADRQVLLISATVNDAAISIAKELMKEPELVKVETDAKSKAKVEHFYVVSEQRDKVNILANVVRESKIKALAFVRDIGNLSVVAEKLAFKQLDVGVLHSDSSKKDRETALKEFRNAEYPILLATDIAARGLDIKELTHVIQYDIPQDASSYTHRSGRTGRQGATGTVISIVTPREERTLKQIAKEIGITLQKREVFGGNLVEEKPQRPQRTFKPKKKNAPTRNKKHTK
ncbi:MULTISPECIES: DEAD/DEAH box helicase [Bacillus]|uniref:DEAD/DEAH box helicase n=1 Tax=Bacillus TaxID=1386 RepID=UPI000BB6DA88|nr:MULTISPECIES: DEAD/DEAH box helicase [Bacillus]